MGAILGVGSTLFMLGSLLLVWNEVISLHPKKMNAEILKGFAPRVEYALRYQTLLVTWLLINVCLTMFNRVKSRAFNPLDETTETGVQMINRVLTNSFESIVISVLAQLIFVSFAEPATILKLIPLINIIQFIGRVTFLAGYPLRRAFGYMCTLWPNLLLCSFNAYKLCEFMFGN